MRTRLALAAALALAGCTTSTTMMTGALPNPTAAPTYGSGTVTPGFSRTLQVAAGGPIAARSVSRCRGTINGPPDFNVVFDTLLGPLVIVAQSAADTVIVVQTPSGEWLCDDNSDGGLNPRLQVLRTRPGTYHVWVGNASEGAPGLFPPASLRIN